MPRMEQEKPGDVPIKEVVIRLNLYFGLNVLRIGQ